MEHQINYPKIENAVFNGIKRTINRFRENPFYYFTEADIHSSLHSDIVRESSMIMYYPINDKYRVSIVHQEYPTAFRYKRNDLGKNIYQVNFALTDPEGNYGDRGNYDLVVLDPDFINRESDSVIKHLKEIINKDISTKSHKIIKPLFFVEVKFIHLFNFNHKNMLNEVKNDNEKLKLALKYTPTAKAVNLVFCSAVQTKNTIINDIKTYIESYSHKEIANLFIQTYIEQNNPLDVKKITIKPVTNKLNGPEWIKSIIN